jgi:apolipoprotein N-acyltransferase
MPELQRRAKKGLPAVAQLLVGLLTLPPFGLSFLSLVAFIPVAYLLLEPKRLWEAVINGFLYGLLLGACIYWGGGAKFALPVGFVIGITWATSVLLTGLAYRRTGEPFTLFLLPLIWTCFELGFEYVDFGGFTIGISATSMPIFAQLASLGGPYLLSFTLYTINIGLLITLSAQLSPRTRRGAGGIVTAFTLLLLSYGTYRLLTPLEKGELISVVVVQSFVDFEYVNDDGELTPTQSGQNPLKQWKEILTEIAAAEPELVVLPESEFGHSVGVPNEVFTTDPVPIPENLKKTIWMMYKKALVPGQPSKVKKYIVSYHPEKGILHTQPKVRALPVAETNVITGVAAEVRTHSRVTGNPASLICYESVLGVMNRRYAKQNPGFITVASGAINTLAAAKPYLREIEYVQLEINRLRAIESGRYVLRAANAVGSAIIDPRGRLIAKAPDNQFSILTNTIQTQQEQTPYMRIVAWMTP